MVLFDDEVKVLSCLITTISKIFFYKLTHLVIFISFFSNFYVIVVYFFLLQNAMAYTFGSSFVCWSTDVAKEVTISHFVLFSFFSLAFYYSSLMRIHSVITLFVFFLSSFSLHIWYNEQGTYFSTVQIQWDYCTSGLVFISVKLLIIQSLNPAWPTYADWSTNAFYRSNVF